MTYFVGYSVADLEGRSSPLTPALSLPSLDQGFFKLIIEIMFQKFTVKHKRKTLQLHMLYESILLNMYIMQTIANGFA